MSKTFDITELTEEMLASMDKSQLKQLCAHVALSALRTQDYNRYQADAACKALNTILAIDKHVGIPDVERLEQLAERMEAASARIHGGKPQRIAVPPKDA